MRVLAVVFALTLVMSASAFVGENFVESEMTEVSRKALNLFRGLAENLSHNNDVKRSDALMKFADGIEEATEYATKEVVSSSDSSSSDSTLLDTCIAALTTASSTMTSCGIDASSSTMAFNTTQLDAMCAKTCLDNVISAYTNLQTTCNAAAAADGHQVAQASSSMSVASMFTFICTRNENGEYCMAKTVSIPRAHTKINPQRNIFSTLSHDSNLADIISRRFADGLGPV
jgi:hypothetical protein